MTRNSAKDFGTGDVKDFDSDSGAGILRLPPSARGVSGGLRSECSIERFGVSCTSNKLLAGGPLNGGSELLDAGSFVCKPDCLH